MGCRPALSILYVLGRDDLWTLIFSSEPKLVVARKILCIETIRGDLHFPVGALYIPKCPLDFHFTMIGTVYAEGGTLEEVAHYLKARTLGQLVTT